MRVASLHIGHDASLSFFDGQNLAFFLQERYSKIKHDSSYFYCLEKFLDINCYVDLFVVSSFDDTVIRILENDGTFKTFSLKYKQKYGHFLNIIFDYSHHLFHSSLAFYNSGFDESIVIVVDGSGKNEGSIRECESVYFAKYPDIFTPIFKNYLITSGNYKHNLDRLRSENPRCEYTAKSKLGVAALYGSCACHFGEDELSAGKIMGLQSYGKETFTPYITEKFFVNDTNFFIDYKNLKCYNKNIRVTNKITKDNCEVYANYAKDLQVQTETVIVELIRKSIDQTGIKKVCITGGYGMNVIANSKYRREFANVEFYNEPLSMDCGISLGSCFFYYRNNTKDMKKKPIRNPYFHGQLTKIN